MIRKRYIWLPSLIVVVLLTLVSLFFVTLARQSVEVRVFDAATGDLLPHASLETLTPARIQRTSIGWLALDVRRQLAVRVSADGYLPQEADWRAASPWTFQGRLDVSLSPTVLTGRVRDIETNQPLPQAQILIDARRLTPDAGGAFQCLRVTRDATISVQLDGYRPWQAPLSWNDHLVQGKALTIYLQPNVAEGRVFSLENGQPLEGVVVSAGHRQALTDEAGRFSLSRVPKQGLLTVEGGGFWPQQVAYDDQPLEITLRSDRVEGRVVWEETGEPLAEVEVSAAGQKAITSPDGRFQLHRLAVGQPIDIRREGFVPARLIYEGQGSEMEVALRDRRARLVIGSALEGVKLEGLEVTRNDLELAAVSPGVFDLRACQPSDVLSIGAAGHWPVQMSACASEPEGDDVEQVEVWLQPRVLTVTVRDAYADWPLAQARVASSPPRFTDARGQATLVPAMPDTMITVEREGYAGQSLHYDGQDAELVVRLVPRVLQGRVVDAETGEPVPGVAFRQGGQTIFLSDPEGRFSLDAQARGVEFTVREAGYRLSRVSVGRASPSVLPQSCPGAEAGSAPCWEVRLTPFEVRGVYIPFGLLYSRERTLAILDMIAETELNAVVLDVKGDRGFLAYPSELPLAVEIGVSAGGVMDIHEFLELCHQREIYTIARLVIFKDNPLAHARPDLAVKLADGSVWLDREKLGWANPFREEVWAYNIGIAQEVARLGFDEVQMDYVRFPSDGDLSSIVYEEEATAETKTTAIRTFVTRMRQALEPYDVFLSADVFGLTLVVDPQSGMGIGQRVIDIAPHVDYLCPMVYPSTFIPGNMGIQAPSLHPYEVVAQSLQLGMALTSTRIRPWLQAYSLGVTYGLLEQSKQRWAAEAVGADGWTFWNAGGRYDERVFTRNDVAIESEGWRKE